MLLTFSEYAMKTERFATRPSSIAMFDRMLEKLDLPAGASVLDVGCGTGVHLLRMESRGLQPFGLDVNPEAIKIAQQNGRKCQVYDGLLFPELITDGFDAVVITNTLNHVWAPDEMLYQADQVLKPGGQVGIINPNVSHRYAMTVANWRTGYRGDSTIKKEYGVRGIRRMLRKRFFNIDLEMAGPKKFGISPYMIVTARKAWR